MNKLLKFRQTHDQKHYFVSDTHYNHNPKWQVPLWEARGYSSVDEMNNDIVNKINSVVRPNDFLWHLGDITLNCTEEQFENFISRLVCQNILCLWGNHNSPSWQIYQREVKSWLRCNDEGYNGDNGGTPHTLETDIEIYPFKYKNITFIGNYQEIAIDGQYIVLEHYPISVFNYMDDGGWNLCGHSHYGFAPSTAEHKDNKILDVGWEGKKGVYSIKEIRDIMNTKGIKVVDHHGKTS